MENDVKLGTFKPNGEASRPMVRLNLPTPLSTALIAKGYNRAKIEITAEGILIRPYVHPADAFVPRNLEVAEIPDW